MNTHAPQGDHPSDEAQPALTYSGVTWWAQAWRTLWRDARAGELRSPAYGTRWPFKPSTTKEVDALAVGPNPERRVLPPLAGLRCAKCHHVAPNPNGCGLCNPTGQSRMRAIAEGRISP